ncbi:hypothetical protein QBC40DRAFT_71563 [Triangularia verruculosa]|uniref:Uncharacterized protein n=1 Tax=Triangularia verruculosa TaxID=2587418 RepID=A0AAN6XHP2_9PEZI|nr:hypothetical protein QBC40DRAFT_71563 [Triangularia verruculosa]
MEILSGLVAWLGVGLILMWGLWAVVSAKTLPFAWHARILYTYLRNYHFDSRPTPLSTDGHWTVFQPTIYTISTPIGDLDYLLHKSNSTYLADLDLARGTHFFCLFRAGLKGSPKRVLPALGGVTCNWKKEIPPFAKVEIWTRVLSWDGKWIYFISHFVDADKAKPSRLTDQDVGTTSTGTPQQRPVIYATSLSKYVIKQGRKTVPPDEFLVTCGLLPATQSGSDDVLKGTMGSGAQVAWKQIEEQRQKGLELANHMAALDAGFDWFPLDGQGEVAFAKY